MKILSWNIWVDCHFEELKCFLSESNVDIIGLQEVKDDDPERDVIGFLKKLGYEYVFAKTEQIWNGKVYRHGPAVFSKFPIVNSKTYLIDKEDERAFARADVKVDDRILHIFSTHLIHTHQKPSKQQEAQVNELIKQLPKDNVIMMGDFNATPESEAIKKMREVLVDTGKDSDLTWSVYPEGCPACNPQSIDARLDYIFISKDIKSKNFKVEESTASDHLPISVEIDMQAFLLIKK